jgi:hypothetical protein
VSGFRLCSTLVTRSTADLRSAWCHLRIWRTLRRVLICVKEPHFPLEIARCDLLAATSFSRSKVISVYKPNHPMPPRIAGYGRLATSSTSIAHRDTVVCGNVHQAKERLDSLCHQEPCLPTSYSRVHRVCYCFSNSNSVEETKSQKVSHFSPAPCVESHT